MKAEGRDRNRDNNMKAEGRDGSRQQHEGGRPRRQERHQCRRDQEHDRTLATTTGQAGAGAKLTSRAAHQDHVRDPAIRKVENVTNVNFSISVGTRVPREGVSFHPLPGGSRDDLSGMARL